MVKQFFILIYHAVLSQFYLRWYSREILADILHLAGKFVYIHRLKYVPVLTSFDETLTSCFVRDNSPTTCEKCLIGYCAKWFLIAC